MKVIGKHVKDMQNTWVIRGSLGAWDHGTGAHHTMGPWTMGLGPKAKPPDPGPKQGLWAWSPGPSSLQAQSPELR